MPAHRLSKNSVASQERLRLQKRQYTDLTNSFHHADKNIRVHTSGYPDKGFGESSSCTARAAGCHGRYELDDNNRKKGETDNSDTAIIRSLCTLSMFGITPPRALFRVDVQVNVVGRKPHTGHGEPPSKLQSFTPPPRQCVSGRFVGPTERRHRSENRRFPGSVSMPPKTSKAGSEERVFSSTLPLFPAS